MSYVAPLKDMLFNIEHLALIDQVAQMPGFEDAGLETAQAVLQECAKLNQDVLAPLNWEGDKNPSSFSNGQSRPHQASKKHSSNMVKVAGKVCSIPLNLVVKVCPKPLAQLAVKCSTRPT